MYVTELGLFEVSLFLCLSPSLSPTLSRSLSLSLPPLSLSVFVLLRGGRALCQEVTLQSRADINVGVQRTWRA